MEWCELFRDLHPWECGDFTPYPVTYTCTSGDLGKVKEVCDDML